MGEPLGSFPAVWVRAAQSSELSAKSGRTLVYVGNGRHIFTTLALSLRSSTLWTRFG